jgi:HAD superfamily hydrolase (TIGR01509 family)
VPDSIELVIFDCDGVLIDSERLAIKIDVEILTELGWPITEAEVIERFVGKSAEQEQAEIEAHLGHTLAPNTFKNRFEKLFVKACETELHAVDGVLDALDHIDLPTCVASSSSPERLRFTLGLTGLYDRFENRIFSASEVAAGKPAPDLFPHAAAQMKTDPSACVVVEDSRYGVQAARAAGMRVLAYVDGLTPAAALAGPNTVVFERMSDLPALLAEAASDRRPHVS